MNIPPTTPPCALILCGDGRLSRLLETELAYLGVSARTTEVLPAEGQELSLLVADGDRFPLPACEALAAACGCPLLAFGREDATLPADRGVYLRRPFELAVLEQQARSLLAGIPAHGSLAGASRSAAAPEQTPAPAAEPFLAVDPASGAVTLEGAAIPLTPAEAAILDCLYTHRGEDVSRETLAALLGGGGNSVEVYVCKLRTKLEKPLGRPMITTVRGIGYRLEI